MAILLAAIIALHALLGGSGGVVVLCLGGGHQHAPAEADHCESQCRHGDSVPLPTPVQEHGHDCGCTDIEVAVAEIVTLPRGEDGMGVAPAIVPAPSWGVVVADAGLGRRGPPNPPPWFDPGGAQRLAIVASVRLTI